MPPPPYAGPLARPARVLVALLLALGHAAALAAWVRVGELRLDYDDTWQRASPEEEASVDSVILRRADAAGTLTITAPRHQSRLHVPEARFYQQLETVWRAAAGDALRLDWLEAGGRRWRVARRPSVEETDRVVFHLVTVSDGLAQHLLVCVPATVADLPPAVPALLAGPSSPAPAAPATQLTPVPEVHPLNRVSPLTRAVWRLERSLSVLPDADAFERLLRQERDRLPRDGGITGLGIEGRAHGFTAFLSGFVLAPGADGRMHRQAFSHTWDVAWEAPATELPSGPTLRLHASRLPPGVGLQVSLRQYCGSVEALARLVQRLGQSAAVDPEAATSRDCGGLTAGRALAEILGATTPARAVVFSVEAAPVTDQQQHLLVLSVQPFIVGAAPGAALFAAAAVHYVYHPAPGRASQKHE